MGVDIGSILESQPTDFAGAHGVVAVDAFNTLYQFLTIIRQKDGTPLTDSHGHVTSHLSGLLYRTCNMLEKGVTPVFVFDGPPHELKKQTLKERAERKAKALEQFIAAKEAGRVEEAAMLSQRFVKLTPDIVDESKKLLGLMGLPIVQAPSEGEAQCAWMADQGIVPATASQDFDALLFGTPVLFRNLTIAGRRKLPRRDQYVDVVPERIDLAANLARLGIDRRRLIWIGILAGNDFSAGVNGIGAKKGLKLVKEFDSLSAIFKKLGQPEPNVDAVENLFMNPPHVDVSKESLKPKPVDREAIIKFMVDEHDFSPERVNSVLDRAFENPVGSNQTGLGSWQ